MEETMRNPRYEEELFYRRVDYEFYERGCQEKTTPCLADRSFFFS
jgi:hypothetical protein